MFDTTVFCLCFTITNLYFVYKGKKYFANKKIKTCEYILLCMLTNFLFKMSIFRFFHVDATDMDL